MKADPVVITGAGLVSSLGTSTEETWSALLRGESGIGPVQGFDAGGFSCRSAAQVQGLTPQTLGVNNRDARIMDVHSLVLLKASRDAFLSSRWGNCELPREAIGLFAGMGMVDYGVEDLLPAVLQSRSGGSFSYPSFYSGGYKEIYPLWPLSMLNNVTFCQVSILLDVRGDNTVLSPHGDSGMQAVAEALHSVADGRSRVALAAGVSETVNPCSLARAHLAGILNTSEGHLERPCSPFSPGRSGTVIGEGCGAVAFEPLSSARRRGIRVLGSVSGYGFAFEREAGDASPTEAAMALAMKRALESAGLSPSDVDVIIAHGDGTVRGDENEMEAICGVFSDGLDRAAVYTSKQALGHTLAAAPVLDLVLALRMIGEGHVPALSHGMVDSRMEKCLVRGEPLTREVARVLINCMSYEGQAASLVVERVEG